MEAFIVQLQRFCHSRTRRLISVMGTVVILVLVLQTFTLPSKIALSPLFPSSLTPVFQKGSPKPREDTSTKSIRIGKLSLLSDTHNSTYSSVDFQKTGTAEISDLDSGSYVMDEHLEEDSDLDDDVDLGEEEDPDTEFSFDLGNGVTLKKVRDSVGGFITLERVIDTKYNSSLREMGVQGDGLAYVSDGTIEPSSLPSETVISSMTIERKGIFDATSSIPSLRKDEMKGVASSKQVAKQTLVENEALLPVHGGSAALNVDSTSITTTSGQLKKKKRVMPPISISEMNELLLRNRASHRSMRPRWSSAHDKEMLAVKAQIENAPIVKSDRQLHAPAFRNISMFKRSYELMERMLKVYVYKEGQKPIFHEAMLKGIYASEGWFMKLMESNRRYVVKDPRKAHLFYMPFSSRLLQFALYVRNSHNRRNLEQHLREYVDTIAAKYPFWNRTGGADHFLAACHDWAPYETRHTMERAIRALCVADLREGFRLGKDISLPETYVRSAKNPLRDLGGKATNNRPILAFFAGSLHGRLRPILLQHWENKDPDMKIFGPMPRGVSSKMSYINYMKSSKYCICPRGYEANSPRVVESIFYECVPVLISDNYVPPFFEVLNWEAFSVIIPEKDVPRLKEILMSISDEKYVSLQKGVRRVQQHFLWHSKPVKYDLFHMILHSIWLNRVYNVRTR